MRAWSGTVKTRSGVEKIGRMLISISLDMTAPFVLRNARISSGQHGVKLARIIHGHLLRQLILSRGCPLLFKLQWAVGFSPRRTDDPLHLGEQQVPRFGLNSLATA